MASFGTRIFADGLSEDEVVTGVLIRKGHFGQTDTGRPCGG